MQALVPPQTFSGQRRSLQLLRQLSPSTANPAETATETRRSEADPAACGAALKRGKGLGYARTMRSLLIIEDDELLRDGLSAQLAQLGHKVTWAADGEAALLLLEANRFDGVLLDLGLPKINGMEVLRWIRKRLPALPVLILTARDDVDDRVQGLNAGADDYLTKPFELAELQARLGAMLRRASLPAFGGSLEVASHSARRLRVDAKLPQAWLGEEALELTQREWALLSLLVTHAGRVVSREDVLETWQAEPGDSASGAAPAGLVSNALEVYIHRLRRKLVDSGLNIRNVRGLGYMLETTPQ
jgi:DNA-binding response OmpR family regulator